MCAKESRSKRALTKGIASLPLVLIAVHRCNLGKQMTAGQLRFAHPRVPRGLAISSVKAQVSALCGDDVDL